MDGVLCDPGFYRPIWSATQYLEVLYFEYAAKAEFSSRDRCWDGIQEHLAFYEPLSWLSSIRSEIPLHDKFSESSISKG